MVRLRSQLDDDNKYKGDPKYKQGRYKLRHPEKYVGDPNNVIFRSSWELHANQFFDNNPNVLRWASEEIKIPYVKPTTGKVHHYYPDYWIEVRTKSGNIVQELIEVKPEDQVNINKKKRLSRYDQLTYAINQSKWQAATKFCEQHNMKFTLLTERQLFRN